MSTIKNFQPNQKVEEGMILDLLTHEGITYRPKFKMWRGTVKLTPEDLGINSSDFTTEDAKDMITLGRKQLVPKNFLNAITSIERKMNAFMIANGRSIFNAGYFIPNVNIPKTEKYIEELEVEWNEETTKFVNNWANTVSASKALWQKFFFNRLPSGKIQKALSALDQYYPEVFELRKKFDFRVSRMNIRLPTESIEMKALDLESYRENAGSQEVARQAAKLAAEKEAKLFINEAIINLRSELGEVCDDLLNSLIESKNGIHQKTLNRFEAIKEHFKAMNFTGDEVVNQLAEGMWKKAKEHTAKELRDDPEALGKLAETIKLVGVQAKALAKQDSQDIVDKFIKQGKRKIIQPFGENK